MPEARFSLLDFKRELHNSRASGQFTLPSATKKNGTAQKSNHGTGQKVLRKSSTICDLTEKERKKTRASRESSCNCKAVDDQRNLLKEVRKELKRSASLESRREEKKKKKKHRKEIKRTYRSCDDESSYSPLPKTKSYDRDGFKDRKTLRRSDSRRSDGRKNNEQSTGSNDSTKCHSGNSSLKCQSHNGSRNRPNGSSHSSSKNACKNASMRHPQHPNAPMMYPPDNHADFGGCEVREFRRTRSLKTEKSCPQSDDTSSDDNQNRSHMRSTRSGGDTRKRNKNSADDERRMLKKSKSLTSKGSGKTNKSGRSSTRYTDSPSTMCRSGSRNQQKYVKQRSLKDTPSTNSCAPSPLTSEEAAEHQQYFVVNKGGGDFVVKKKQPVFVVHNDGSCACSIM